MQKLGAGYREYVPPDQVKSLRGVRVWRVVHDIRGYALSGMWTGSWELPEETARCLPYSPLVGVSQGPACSGLKPDCACGFYARFSTNLDTMELKLPLSVLGIIEGFGKMMIGTQGFRCQKARVLALCAIQTIQRPYNLDGWFSAGWVPARYWEPVESWELREAVRGTGIPVFRNFSDMVSEFPPSTTQELEGIF